MLNSLGRVLVAPDSFKGTFTAEQVAEAIGAGMRTPGYECDLCPIADGGEGTLDALIGTGTRHWVAVQDPLGRPVTAAFGLDGNVGIVETAGASGLGLVRAGERDPIRASTFGTGELIAAAVAAGARTVLLGVGGSATTDGGAGAVEALTASGGLQGAQLIVLCDVQTPFEDAARVFAPQKGAEPHDVVALTARLNDLALAYPRDPRGVPRTGAAGGLAGGLWANFEAELVGGAGFILDRLGFEARCGRALAVVTGEGKLDHQSGAGKAVSEVATRARRMGVTCLAVVGTLELEAEAWRQLGLTAVRTGSTLAEIELAAQALGRGLAATSFTG